MESSQTRKWNKSKNVFFRMAANFFVWLSRKTGRTYNELNVLMYFGIVPFSWAFILDFQMGWGYFSIGFFCFTAGVLVAARDFSTFADHAFKRSVEFLLFFNRYGSNYERTSVVICVVLPIIVYILLVCLILF